MRVGWSFLLLALQGPVALAQETSPPMCYNGADSTPPVTVGLPQGYQVELRLQPDSLEPGMCTATIRNPHDSVVWKAEGFGTSVDQWTGHDVDGDGEADAVIGVDTGGGNRCCCGFFILRFTPAFKVVEWWMFTPFFDLDEQGRTLIWEVVPYYSLGPDMASSPTVVRVYQFRNGLLADITLERCDQILSRSPGGQGNILGRAEEWELVTPDRLAASREAQEVTSDVLETRVAVISLVLQHLACGRPDDARGLVERAWGSAEASQQWTRLRAEWEATSDR